MMKEIFNTAQGYYYYHYYYYYYYYYSVIVKTAKQLTYACRSNSWVQADNKNPRKLRSP